MLVMIVEYSFWKHMMILDSQVSNGAMRKTFKKFGFVFALFSVIIEIALNNAGHAQQMTVPDADVVIVGAGSFHLIRP